LLFGQVECSWGSCILTKGASVNMMFSFLILQ
jgi:hypothetical protein